MREIIALPFVMTVCNPLTQSLRHNGQRGGGAKGRRLLRTTVRVPSSRPLLNPSSWNHTSCPIVRSAIHPVISAGAPYILVISTEAKRSGEIPAFGPARTLHGEALALTAKNLPALSH